MVSFNLCTFIGNVGPAPELKTASDGSRYIRFRLAVETEFRKDATSSPMRLSVVAWRNLAEAVAKVVRKGSLVLVSGKLSMRSYTDKEETQRTSVEIIAQTVQVLPTGTGKEEKTEKEDTAVNNTIVQTGKPTKGE